MLAKELGSTVTFTLQNLLYYNFSPTLNSLMSDYFAYSIAFNTFKVPKTLKYFSPSNPCFLANNDIIKLRFCTF